MKVPLPPSSSSLRLQATADEIQAWFKEKQNMDMPDGLMDREDADKDGFVSWEEFSGPKGDAPPAQP